MGQRNQLVDNLRGFSMIVIIFTHTTAFFPNDKVAFTLWNWSNFAVPIFIFCSAYLYFKQSVNKPLHFVSYLKKRFMRLLLPYYIFLLFFLIVLFFISPQLLSIKYLWQSILVIGGVDINWLVLLFLYITILLPFFVWSQKKLPLLFWAFFILSFSSSVYLVFGHFTISYKWIMWLPWSLVLFFTWYYVKYEQNKKKLGWMLAINFLLFVLSFEVLNVLHQSTVLIHNKYPPNLLYLAYGITILLGLVFIEKYLFRLKSIQAVLNFFSRYSYSIFFLHYLILTIAAAFITKFHLAWYILFCFVLGMTILFQYLYNLLKWK